MPDGKGVNVEGAHAVRVGQWGFAPFFASSFKQGRPASTPLEAWISLFPTAPLFGVRWFFSDMAEGVAGVSGKPVPARASAVSEAAGEAQSVREQAALNRTRVRAAPQPAIAPSAPIEEPVISLDDVGVGAISDLTALGGVAAAFSSDVDAQRAQRETEKLEKPAPKPIRTADPATPTAQPSKSETAPKKAPSKTAPKTSSKAAPRKSVAKKAAAAPDPSAPRSKPGVPFAVYDTAPAKPDDLTQIKGVGPKLAAVLNDRGVFTFDQIAGFDAAAYAWLDQTLGAFKGRGERDDWAGQAKALTQK